MILQFYLGDLSQWEHMRLLLCHRVWNAIFFPSLFRTAETCNARKEGAGWYHHIDDPAPIASTREPTLLALLFRPQLCASPSNPTMAKNPLAMELSIAGGCPVAMPSLNVEPAATFAKSAAASVVRELTTILVLAVNSR